MDTQDIKSLCNQILKAGKNRYSLQVGIVSRIENAKYGVFAVDSETGIPTKGDVYELDAVYCRDVYNQKRTMAITEIDNVPGMKLHPLYDGFPIEVYISSPITVDNKVWGTLNFSSLEVRDTPFSDEDIQFNENQAERIANMISGQT